MNTNAPTHNNNVSADKPSTMEAIKEKASAVVDKLTGKHHTDDTHGHDHHHDNKDRNLPGDHAVHTTGPIGNQPGPMGNQTGTHTGPIGNQPGPMGNQTGTHTGPIGNQPGPIGNQPGPMGNQTGTKPTGTHTGPVGTHTGGAHAGAHAGAVPGVVPTATHSTGAGITAGGNIAPPTATHGTHDTHIPHGTQGTHDTHIPHGTQGTHGTQVPHGTGLAGAAATQPLNQQHNHPAGQLHEGTTTGGVNNNQAALASTTAETRDQIAQVANMAYRHPEKVDQAVDAATANLVGHQPSSPTAHAAAADVIANNPNKAETFAKDVTSRLVGQPGDPNNLESAHIKPTM